MFCILDGSVDVLIGEHHVMSLVAGEIIGEMALVDDDHVRTANVRAATAVTVAPVAGSSNSRSATIRRSRPR